MDKDKTAIALKNKENQEEYVAGRGFCLRFSPFRSSRESRVGGYADQNDRGRGLFSCRADISRCEVGRM